MHLLIVALGLGALLAASETAFALVKFIGAAYLVWLGIQRWRAPPLPADATPDATPVLSKSLFLQGLMVNLTNPKAIVFIGALVPQFVDPVKAQVGQYLLIAVTLCLTDMFVMSCYALAASRLGGWMRDPAAIGSQNRLFGGLFISAGAILAVSSHPL